MPLLRHMPRKRQCGHILPPLPTRIALNSMGIPARGFGIRVALKLCVARSENHIVNIFGWINLAFGLLAASAGVFVLRGVFHTRLSSASTVRFLFASLLASLAGLMPLTHHLSPVQQISILSVYCSGAAIIAWLKFDLRGRARRIFAVSVTAVLYFDLVFVFTHIFRNPPLFTARLAQPLPFIQLVQILFAAAFIGLGILAVRACRIAPPNVPGLGKFTQTY